MKAELLIDTYSAQWAPKAEVLLHAPSGLPSKNVPSIYREFLCVDVRTNRDYVPVLY